MINPKSNSSTIANSKFPILADSSYFLKNFYPNTHPIRLKTLGPPWISSLASLVQSPQESNSLYFDIENRNFEIEKDQPFLSEKEILSYSY